MRQRITARIREPKLKPPHEVTCATKKWFATEEEALRGSVMRAYRCEVCNGFHRTGKNGLIPNGLGKI